MRNVNYLKLNPKADGKIDDIDRTLMVSHVDVMPSKERNHYQDLIKRK